jgi:cell shape-determining protein MreC
MIIIDKGSNDGLKVGDVLLAARVRSLLHWL